LPAAVFAEPRPVQLLSGDGTAITLDARGLLHGQPTLLKAGEDQHQIVGWAGPWSIDERAWDPARHRSASRFQVVDDGGSAWLLVLQGGHWWAEGRYD
jgi:protein ImuB